jgi:hypothetical protein
MARRLSSRLCVSDFGPAGPGDSLHRALCGGNPLKVKGEYIGKPLRIVWVQLETNPSTTTELASPPPRVPRYQVTKQPRAQNLGLLLGAHG